MTYELWDTASRNIVADYATEQDALAAVREAIRLDGREAVATLLLAYEDRHGRTTAIAAGSELGERALGSMVESTATSRSSVGSRRSSSA